VAHDTFWDIVTTIVFESGTHVQREVSHLFPHHSSRWMNIFITKDNFGLWWTSWLLIWLTQYDTMNIDDNINTCNNDGCLIKYTIICWTNIKWWFHSPCYWNIWVFSFSLWFIFDHLCINHYRTSSLIFFNCLDAYFLLSTTHVHNLATCVDHNNFWMGCYTWSGFLISSTHLS
jgi:hypothetical protein